MMKAVTRIFSFFLLIRMEAATAEGNTTEHVGELALENEVMVKPAVAKTTFHMHLRGSLFEDTCAIEPFESDTLSTCNYNTSDPLVIIIHGWTISGKMEEWVLKLASALKTRLEHVNVLIIDWRPLAFHPYPTAAKNARQVGRDVANLLMWLEETTQLSMDKVHLIGYSLGAHAAGFVGSHFPKAKKLGRITGLDPAGPNFEGVPASDRLSPDDAKFVDAIHTFAKSSIGLALGIRQTVGHVDFYPNGGYFQPGCHMADIYNNVYQYGLEGVPKTIKCAHQRSVHLFIESLLKQDQRMIAYRCRDDRAFDQGLCLDCRKDRCNTLGYDVRQVYIGGNSKGFYLKTGPQTPYMAYHYQIKVLLMNLIEQVKASISIALIGSEGESQYTPITLSLEHPENKTYSSLVPVGSVLGELRAVRLRLAGEAWSSWWRRVTTIMSRGGGSNETELIVAKIRLKSGESQEKTWFCDQTAAVTHLKPSQEHEFVRCQYAAKRKRSSRNLQETNIHGKESGKHSDRLKREKSETD
ncbi:hepatic triacylglycerol lipase [Tachysurus fulvidraco]|uniref:hepatic triacylglycerol lipase n=1 Tax=Tachysurus fulvidraco TaxID=1234273 RepID=UPI001FEEF753|nr:hepatic triacylglycerol lipase [Tachysurus fulvidraco]